MTVNTVTPQTAADYEARAIERFAAEQESFERCDTDGFLSQWAHNITGRQDLLQAEILKNGGRSEFVALFDTKGNLVAAKLVDTRYGMAWGILESDDPKSRFIGWFNPSKASDPKKARANDARKGYQVGYVLAPAKAEIAGSGTGLAGAASAYVTARRTDGGFSRDVEIVDNGQGDDATYYRI